jgi:hypothetical protein
MVRPDHNLVSGSVTGTPPKSSTSLTQAKSRLETAVERLDRALVARAKATPTPVTGPEPNQELEAARAEIRRLRETNATISARLDATIGKVKVLIDE